MGFFDWLFGGKEETKTAQGRASMAIEAAPQPSADFEPLARRAVEHLGLIRPEYIPVLTKMAQESQFGRTETTARFSRRAGTQLTREEKKALGLRASVFMSMEALEMLTDKGRQDPLNALETTLHRIWFENNAIREMTRPSSTGLGTTHYIWMSCGDETTCQACWSRNRRRFAYAQARLGQFPGSCDDCTRGWCRCYAAPVLPEFRRRPG